MVRVLHTIKGWLLPHWLTVGLIGVALNPPGAVESGPTLCPHKAITGEDCAGCGMTRAVVHGMHGNWQRAIEFHSLVVIVLPLLILLAIRMSWRGIAKSSPKSSTSLFVDANATRRSIAAPRYN